ncbi:hypothetical protein LPJ59_004289, partial [Coemansia sp. RSA 2399]
ACADQGCDRRAQRHARAFSQIDGHGPAPAVASAARGGSGGPVQGPRVVRHRCGALLRRTGKRLVDGVRRKADSPAIQGRQRTAACFAVRASKGRLPCGTAVRVCRRLPVPHHHRRVAGRRKQACAASAHAAELPPKHCARRRRQPHCQGIRRGDVEAYRVCRQRSAAVVDVCHIAHAPLHHAQRRSGYRRHVCRSRAAGVAAQIQMRGSWAAKVPVLWNASCSATSGPAHMRGSDSVCARARGPLAHRASL